MTSTKINCFASQSSFWIDPQGYVRPCARFQKRMQHISEFSDYSMVTQSQGFKDIRSQHQEGKWPDSCIRCQEDERNGFHSKRSFYDQLSMKANHDFMIDISVGNFCNLKCRMCNPYNSTAWNQDYKILQEKGLVSELSEKGQTKGYILSKEDERRLLQFLTSVPGRIFIELKGGEPLVMPQVPDLMRRMGELPNSKNIHLILVTNGTSAPEWVDQLSRQLGEVQLVVSIDGLGSVYDYIRGGGQYDFEQCVRSIRRFQRMEGVELYFNVVAQNLNIHQLLDIYFYLSQNFNDNINFITLSYPSYWRLNNIPIQARAMILKDYEKRKHLVNSRFIPYFDNVFAWFKEEFDEKSYKKFMDITTTLDGVRGQSLASVAPHLLE